jgi:hypothetical protein
MVPTSAGLGSWLTTLDAPALLELLRARPDTALPPEPATAAELAARLTSVDSVHRAAAKVSQPALQVAEALLAMGGTATEAELARLLGATGGPAAEELERAVKELRSLALLWPVDGRLRISSTWQELLPDPLGLGRPARELFARLTVAQLQRVGSALGVGGVTCKEEWVEAVAAAVADPTTVEARLAGVSPKLAAAVRRIAWHGPRAVGVGFPGTSFGLDPRSTGVQLAVQGWVVPSEWGDFGEMPREVALAVRGPTYRPPFDPTPPAPPTAAVEAERVDAAGRQAAGAAVDAVRRLLALLERSPLATVRTGGVGVRELRRAAKQLPGGEPGVRLWLAVAAAADLVVVAADAVILSTTAEEWLAAAPAEALARLLTAWWRLPVVPHHEVDENGKPSPALRWPVGARGPLFERRDLLRELAALRSEGRGLSDTSDVAALERHLVHRRPVAYAAGRPAPLLRATLAEAALLGVVADGALSSLGAELLAATARADPEAALAAAVAGMIPAPSTTATFLPDLTAVVAGAVARDLGRLLDEAAEVESRDTASMWRFTRASVRRALDGGRSAGSLLAALAEVAENPLPQPLEYLVRDVARRHGELEVLPAGCCMRAADAALAAEVAAHRALAPLELRLLAESVLVSAKPAAETVAALRAAGYAPVRRDERGEAVVERVPVRRAAPCPARRPRGFRRQAVDLPALARRLAG